MHEALVAEVQHLRKVVSAHEERLAASSEAAADAAEARRAVRRCRSEADTKEQQNAELKARHLLGIPRINFCKSKSCTDEDQSYHLSDFALKQLLHDGVGRKVQALTVHAGEACQDNR